MRTAMHAVWVPVIALALVWAYLTYPTAFAAFMVVAGIAGAAACFALYAFISYIEGLGWEMEDDGAMSVVQRDQHPDMVMGNH